MPRFAAVLLVVFVFPAAAVQPLSDYARLSEYETVKISPTGKYIAVTAPIRDQTGLAIIALDGMKLSSAMRLSGGEHVANFWWVGPERVVATVATRDGALAQPLLTGELIGTNADGTQRGYLFGYRGRQSVGSHLSRETLEYASARMVDPLPENPDEALVSLESWRSGVEEAVARVVSLNVYTGRKRNLLSSPTRGATYFLSDRSGEVRYAVGHDEDDLGKSRTFSRAAGDKDWRPLNIGELANAEIVPVAVGEDGDTVYLMSDEADGRSCLVAHQIEEGTRRALACHPVADLDEVILDATGTAPIAAVFEPGHVEIHFVDEEAPDARLLKGLTQSFPGEYVHLTSRTTDGQQVIFGVYSDRNPGDFYLFDRRSNQARYLLSRRSWIDPKQMAAREPISFQARDGVTIHGYLTRPSGAGNGPMPLVVNPHGGPFGLRDTWYWDADAQALASRGYAVLQINFRGSGGYGADYRRAGIRQWGGRMIDDITDGARWAVAEKIADADRMCIYGGSYGGYAALMSAVREPELYKCAIAYAGVYDIEEWADDSDVGQFRKGRAYIERYIAADDAAMAQQSPLTFIDRLKARVLIVHGELDKRVPFSQAKLLRSALDSREYPYEWLSKNNEGHGFYDDKNRTELYEKLISFLNRQIGPEAAP